MGAHRTAAERLAEAQAQVRALMAKVNSEEFLSDPEIQEIDEALETERKESLKYRRWAAEHEDKTQNFLDRAQLWRERGEKAAAYIEEADSRVSTLKEQRVARIEALMAETASNEGDSES